MKGEVMGEEEEREERTDETIAAKFPDRGPEPDNEVRPDPEARPAPNIDHPE